jgi:hypothetical protein
VGGEARRGGGEGEEWAAAADCGVGGAQGRAVGGRMRWEGGRAAII